MLAERLARPAVARCADVSVPWAGEAAPGGQVIQVERLAKAK